MDDLVVIVNSSAVENALLSGQLRAVGGLATRDFADEGMADAWLSGDERANAIILGDVSDNFRARLERLSVLHPIPIIQLEGSQDIQLLGACRALGELVDSLVVKPFAPSVLVEQVAQRLRISPVREPTVLLLDDHRETEALLPQILAGCGFRHVLEASDAATALQLLRQHAEEIALAVCHWELPSLEAAEFLRLGRRSPRWLSLPVLLLTSQSSIEQARGIQRRAEHCHTVISRPLEPSALRGPMEAVVKLVRKERQVMAFLTEAWALAERGEGLKVVECLRRAVVAVPDSVRLLEQMGDALQRPEENDDLSARLRAAASAYELALRLPRCPLRCLEKAADVLARLGRSEEMARVSRPFLQRLGFDDDWRTRLARVYFQGGDYGTARIELRRALNINPGNREAQALLQVSSAFSSPETAPPLKKAS